MKVFWQVSAQVYLFNSKFIIENYGIKKREIGDYFKSLKESSRSSAISIFKENFSTE